MNAANCDQRARPGAGDQCLVVPDYATNIHSPAARWFARGGCAIALATLGVLFTPGACRHVALAAGSPPPGRAPVASQAVLSNLGTTSRWAYPQAAADAHMSPSKRSRVAGRLHFLTEDGQPEVYLALRSHSAPDGPWIEVSLPGRPNGVTGWVPGIALGELHVLHDYLRINRETLRATLFHRGRPAWSASIGVGRPSLPTPPGHFYVREKLRAIGSPVYGPFALGTSAYSPALSEWPGGGVIGIHGTNEPQRIPGRPSHGCIRLRNADITRLWLRIEVGTPIEIL